MSSVVEIALFTDDVPGVRAFSERHLGSPPESEWPGRSIFAADGSSCWCTSARNSSRADRRTRIASRIATQDVDAARAALHAGGVPLVVGPRDRDLPWGRSAYLHDPDGRLVELCQA